MDFFKPDYVKFWQAKPVKFIDVELGAGDCLYVPAFYYTQSKTREGDESLLITNTYPAHSEFVDMFMDGIEKNGWTDDDSTSYDKQIMKFLNQFY